MKISTFLAAVALLATMSNAAEQISFTDSPAPTNHTKHPKHTKHSKAPKTTSPATSAIPTETVPVPTETTPVPTETTSVPTETTSATPSASAGCTLTGTYKAGTDISSCTNVVINNLNVPAGVTLDLTKVKSGASITFQGTTTFGTQLWAGPLILLTGTNVKVGGTGVLDGQGSWYWPKGQSVTRPVFFRLNHVSSSTLSGFTIKNSPFRTFSILDSTQTTLDGLTLDSSAGDNLAKNTDGFDLSRNNQVTIRNCKIYNQDDCLAMQSSSNTFFLNNYCHGGHGISIGSLGGDTVSSSDTVDGLTVYNNQIVNNKNGLRIKTIVDLVGVVQNVNYTSNVLTNVDNAIVMHSDYSKAKGGYTGSATSKVTIKGVTINGLSGTAKNLYDVVVNPSIASDWQFSGVTVKASSVGTCKNQPANIKCA